MTFSEFKDALFARAKSYGFTDYELYRDAANSFSVQIFKGEINEYKNTQSEGLSFRGTYNGRVGYAYTEKPDESVIDGLVENAAANAGIIEEKEIEKLYPGDAEYPKADNFNPALSGVAAAEKIEKALAMEKYAYSLDERVKSVDYCVVGSDEGATGIANSYGLDVSEVSNLVYAYIGARVEADGSVKTGFEVWHGNDFNAFDYKKIAESAVEKAVSSLGAKPVPSGEYPVIFNNETACDLFSTFTGVFFAENAQKGFSMLKDKAGEKIAGENVTIRDDGICAKSFGSVSFDSEGVASQNKAVIENGVLRTLLYNTKSAEKDGVKSTGNGFKPSFRASVATACTNFYLVPSEKSPDEMMAGVENGVLITELAGLHSGTNTVSGDFSLSATGYTVENGKRGRPVEQVTVAGNFYELLKNIADIADDLRFDLPSQRGTIGMPSILANGLRISGL